jgi:DNA polymerase-4
MGGEGAHRRIVHVDMDAFYASVEQRDDPSLRGRPVVVAWKGARSVVCAASYEARTYGIRSAMPALRAERLCPDAVFVPPDFTRYKAVSRATREIFARHTALIEPLSLDEAYLDVTAPRSGLASGTAVATAIRDAIREELRLTASAGIAPNKFLAKIASDWMKPDGQFVIRPREVEAFVAALPVGRFPGVGKVGEGRLAELGVATGADLRAQPLAMLEARFGRWGRRLHELARGHDERPVEPDRPVQSVSAEDTFPEDRLREALAEPIRALAARAWTASRKTPRIARTVVLKLKTRDFRLLTRSLTPAQPPADAAAVIDAALALLARVDDDGGRTRYRLVGVGLSNFLDEAEARPAQPDLFTSADG